MAEDDDKFEFPGNKSPERLSSLTRKKQVVEVSGVGTMLALNLSHLIA